MTARSSSQRHRANPFARETAPRPAILLQQGCPEKRRGGDYPPKASGPSIMRKYRLPPTLTRPKCAAGGSRGTFSEADSPLSYDGYSSNRLKAPSSSWN